MKVKSFIIKGIVFFCEEVFAIGKCPNTNCDNDFCFNTVFYKHKTKFYCKECIKKELEKEWEELRKYEE